jgi:hypothetical protein
VVPLNKSRDVDVELFRRKIPPGSSCCPPWVPEPFSPEVDEGSRNFSFGILGITVHDSFLPDNPDEEVGRDGAPANIPRSCSLLFSLSGSRSRDFARRRSESKRLESSLPSIDRFVSGFGERLGSAGVVDPETPVDGGGRTSVTVETALRIPALANSTLTVVVLAPIAGAIFGATLVVTGFFFAMALDPVESPARSASLPEAIIVSSSSAVLSIPVAPKRFVIGAAIHPRPLDADRGIIDLPRSASLTPPS